ncbi:MAG: twin-arginine translocase TatA/TatE family subunit [Alphaproteobacteria bacterium]|nr:twin-arginine translocase TatA/TatE family subunit [Alphaproteobacteria bacterium]
MNIGIWELLLLLVVVLLLFGTGKLTRAMGDLARGVRSFRDGMKDTGAAAEAPEPEAAAAEPLKSLPSPRAAAPRAEADAVSRHDQPARP